MNMPINKSMNRQRPAAHLSHLTRLCLGLGALTFTSATLAQAPAAALEEIVVTALRVETNVQNTPIAMEVLDGDSLRDQGINNVTELALVSPSVNVTGYGGGTVVTMRGISSRDTTEIGDPAVVVSVDGFYQDRSYALGLAQYDLDRIEVLRGPQGTLYGRNATGGAINMFTVRPGKEPGGQVQVDFGNFGTLNSEGGINVPLTDKVQMRASFGTQYHDGYRFGGFYGKLDDANSRSGRLQFAYQPIDNLELHVTAQHTVQTALGNSANQKPYVVLPTTSCTTAALGTFPCAYVDHSQIPDLGDPENYTKYQYSQLNLDDTQYRWDARYTAPFAIITYLGGYDRLKWDSWNPALNFDTPINFAAPRSFASVYNQTEKPKTTNHELRFQSADPQARLDWQFGVFYFNNENKLDSHNQRPNGTTSPQTVIHFIYDVEIESLAEMAQVAFNFTDEFKATAGYRHNQDEKTRVGNIFFTNTLPPGTPPVVSPTTDLSQDTYHFGLDWQFSQTSLLYGKFDTGYKSGGFTDVAPYGPEEVETYELGSKNRFMGDRMQLNIAAYYSDYTGQQVQQIVSGGGGLRIENAGETRIQGVEADWVLAYEAGQVELNVAYLDAEFTKFDLAYGAPVFNYNTAAWVNLPAVNVDLKGNRPQQAPEWTVAGALEHTFFGFAGGDLKLRLQGRYQTEQFYTFFNRPNDTQKAYGTADFIGTYTPNDGPWQIQAYVKNLTDEVVFSNAGPNDRGHVYAYTYQPPMTYGARVSYNW